MMRRKDSACMHACTTHTHTHIPAYINTCVRTDLNTCVYGCVSQGIPTMLQIVIILGSSLISSFGYFRIIRTSFFIKIFTGLWLLCMGQQSWAIMVFFFVERFVEEVNERERATFNLWCRWCQNCQPNCLFLGMIVSFPRSSALSLHDAR